MLKCSVDSRALSPFLIHGSSSHSEISPPRHHTHTHHDLVSPTHVFVPLLRASFPSSPPKPVPIALLRPVRCRPRLFSIFCEIVSPPFIFSFSLFDTLVCLLAYSRAAVAFIFSSWTPILFALRSDPTPNTIVWPVASYASFLLQEVRFACLLSVTADATTEALAYPTILKALVRAGTYMSRQNCAKSWRPVGQRF